MSEKIKEKKEKHEFQTEVKQLLDILVYSLYKNREVFLRELISNAVDALNKVHFQLLTEKDMDNKDLDLRINISFNQTQKKLIIEDTGIGMTRKELIDNIGTIAHSGAAQFLKKLSKSDSKDQMSLIGQFGVGFYSSFMVAREIRIITRSSRKRSKAYLWISKGDKNFTLEETVKKTRGTRIELILKKEHEKDLLDKFTIKNIIDTHSKFIPFPIYVEGDKIESTEAIWTQPKASLKKEDYNHFYQFINHTKEEPETYLHFSSDAPVQFHAMIFVPKTSLEALGFIKTEPGIDLYSQKVLIQKGNKDIMPEYMRFLVGVIDSEDIPLNISRETIQNNIKIDKIRKYILKKIFEKLESIKNKDREKYLSLWKNFHRNLKEGIITDFDNRSKIAPLLLYYSSKESKDKLIDLNEYISRMAKDQKEIYYITGHKLDSLEKSPALEAFKKKDIEVLFLVDPLDEFVIEHLREFKDKSFKIAEGADIKLDDKETEEKDKDLIKELNDFVAYLKKVYGERVEDVRLSKRLVDSPCILVHRAGGPSIQMEKVMKMSNKDYIFTKRIIEINQKNDLIKEMVRIHKVSPTSGELNKLANQLLENMLLREGILEDMDGSILRLQDIMLIAAKKI
jgi:molecular chaperone HtpG